MRLSVMKILGVVLSMAVILISNHALAQEQSQDNQTSNPKPELSVAVPDLADIIPLAAKLSDRLAALEYNLSVQRVKA